MSRVCKILMQFIVVRKNLKFVPKNQKWCQNQKCLYQIHKWNPITFEGTKIYNYVIINSIWSGYNIYKNILKQKKTQSRHFHASINTIFYNYIIVNNYIVLHQYQKCTVYEFFLLLTFFWFEKFNDHLSVAAEPHACQARMITNTFIRTQLISCLRRCHAIYHRRKQWRDWVNLVTFVPKKI